MDNFSLYWAVPQQILHPDHINESMHVLINNQTRIRESDGREWISRIPAVSFFIPDQWFNIVALIEAQGIRYYCNIASPPYVSGDTLTYIDYDLDVVPTPDGQVQVVVPLFMIPEKHGGLSLIMWNVFYCSDLIRSGYFFAFLCMSNIQKK